MNSMYLSELIQKLEEIQKKRGDLPVRIQSLTHLFDPEPTVRERGVHSYVILNP